MVAAPGAWAGLARTKIPSVQMFRGLALSLLAWGPMLRRLMRSRLLFGPPIALAVMIATAWGVGALYYADLLAPRVAAVTFAAATVLAFALLPWRRALAGFLVVFFLLVAWWLRIPASNDRAWQRDVAVTPRATVAGDRVTIHGVRNFEYATETEFVERWEDRTYDLGRLDAVDLIASYWAGRAIAHVFVSFGFGSDHVAVSVETRKERHEQYSTISGLFKQYELVYVVADERDLVRLRTTVRQPNEDVHVYRLRGTREEMRRVFFTYVEAINQLHAHPRFYNTLTTNCTTAVLFNLRANPDRAAWTWKILLSGYAPQYAYDLGRLDTSLPFAELERRAHVNARAHAADRDPRFADRIRDGLPQPNPR
jgi:Domain of unknown function (DUF4105)